MLIPYNGCPGSQKAFKKAVALAELTKSKITILTCLESKSTFGLFKTKTNKQEFEREHKLVSLEHAKLEKYATEKGVSSNYKIITNNVASEAILEYTEKQNVDLIIMGIKKRTRYEKTHFPSTIEYVSKNFQGALLILN
jgi:nucleotide-binding universal stress UspA family protein